MKLLNENALTPEEISQCINIPEKQISSTISELVIDGQIYKKKDYYVSYRYREEWHKKNKKGWTIAALVLGSIILAYGIDLSLESERPHFMLGIGIGLLVTAIVIMKSKLWSRWSN